MREIRLDTKVFEGVIEQEVCSEFPGGCTQSIYKEIINLREQGVREALVELGWTPPNDKEFENKTKLHLEKKIQELEMRNHNTVKELKLAYAKLACAEKKQNREKEKTCGECKCSTEADPKRFIKDILYCQEKDVHIPASNDICECFDRLNDPTLEISIDPVADLQSKLYSERFKVEKLTKENQRIADQVKALEVTNKHLRKQNRIIQGKMNIERVISENLMEQRGRLYGEVETVKQKLEEKDRMLDWINAFI